MTSIQRDRVPLARPVPMKEVPLVDRTEEINALKEALYGAVHGTGGLVFIHGEAGIGKTRLLRELGAYARSRGVQVLYGRCPALFRMDGVPPYVLWKEVIKDYLEICTLEHLDKVIGFYPAEVAKLVPELRQRLATIPQSFPIGPEQEQNRLFEAVSQFITNISRENPLLVILDDLQWTDPSSLLLLHYLARGVQKTSLLLLGAYRSTDIDDKHPLTPVLTELKRERLPQSVSLKRMSLDDASEMIRQILEQDDVPPEFCKIVYGKTRGNPFFTEEVIESLKEEEIIYREDSRWKIKEVTRIEFPDTVKNLIKARISRLDDEHQHVLTMASLVGNEFTFEALQGVIGLEEDRLRKVVDALLKTGLLKHRAVHGEEDVCSFADIIVRDVVYEEVGTFERKKLHRVVGTALEKVYARKVDEHLGELALHFLEGGDKDKALDYFLRAGDKASKIYANREAVSYFQSALRLLEEKEGRTREEGRVLETLGDIESFVGEYDVCLERWNEAIQLWMQLGEKALAAKLHRKMADVLWHEVGKPEGAQEHFDMALSILEAQAESAELATLYAARARMSWFTEDATKTRTWAEKAFELSRKLNASEAMAISYEAFGFLHGAAGDMMKSVECMETSLKIALDNGYVNMALRLYNNLAVNLPPGTEEKQRGRECFEKGLELAKKAGTSSWIAWFGGMLANMWFDMGDMTKALMLAEDCNTLNRKIGNQFQLSASTALLGFLYLTLGEWDQGEEYSKEALSISQRIGNTQQISGSYLNLGWLYYQRGEFVKAKGYYEKAFEILERWGQEAYRIGSYPLAVLNYIELGELDRTRTLVDEMHKFAHEKQSKGLIADEDFARACLLRAEKKFNESIGLFERSLQEYEALGARKWNVYLLASTLYEYARAYLERNQPGDIEASDKLLDEALEIYQKLGAKQDIEKVEAMMPFVETSKVVPKPKPIELVPTGYVDLDRLLFGGIPTEYAVVLTSRSCNERNTLVKSFLETGVKKDEVAFYVTVYTGLAKALAEELTSNFQLFVCNPEADAIIKSSPTVHTLKGVENLTDISIALTSEIRKLDPTLRRPRRICLGLVSDVLLYHHAVETRRWLSALMTKLKSEGFTTLAVMDPEMHSPQDTRAILDLFDGEVGIFEKEAEKSGARFLKIRKMGNQEYLKDELRLTKEEPQKRQ